MPAESTQNLRIVQNLIKDSQITLQRRANGVFKQQIQMIQRENRLLNKEDEKPYSLHPERMERLGKLELWCEDNDVHLTDPTHYHERYCCLMHVLGLPKHRITGLPTPPTPYQLEYFQNVDATKEASKGLTANKFHLNKGRQMGFTEIMLYIIIYYCFRQYAGFKVGIIAATRGELARENLHRLKAMLHNIWDTVVWNTKGEEKIWLTNGTTIAAFPASREAITGLTQFKCIYMDEAAKWTLVDDMPIFNSIMPIVRAAAGDLFLVSTPLGPIKMFYAVHKNPKDFIKYVYDIWCTKGNMYTEEQIRELLDNSIEDPAQEYLCQFTYGKNAILGTVGDDIRDADSVEWDVAIEMDQAEEWEDPAGTVPDNFIPVPEQK